jgi:hypothetical protein
MTLLYSLNGNRPAPLPFRITLPNGFTRTDPSTFTEDEILAAGFTGPYVEPPYAPATEQLDWIDGAFVVEVLPPSFSTPRWVEFSSSIMAMPAINAMLGAVLQAAPGLYGGLVVGLQQASEGDSRVFLSSWNAAHAAGLLTTELIIAMQEIAAEYELPEKFIEALAAYQMVRARNEDGTFKSDDPATPNVDEAWVASA